MDRLYRTVAQLSRFKVRRDDDFIDRVHYVYTTVILIMFSIIVSTRQYVGEPIVCWTPAHFTTSHQRYTNNICWIANTYWLPISQSIPEFVPSRKQTEIGYYQWVPFILLLKTIVFLLPCLVWRTLSSRSGISIRSVVEIAVDIQNLNPEHRMKCVKYLTRHMEMCLDNLREYRNGWFVRLKQRLAKVFCLCGRRYGNYLVFCYILVKLLYITNVVSLLVMINVFIGTNHTFYGFEFVNDIRHNRDWRESGRFPRVTMCDFEIRQLGNVHRHTVQCVLPINMFNEKIFLFLWFWYLLLAAVTALNLFRWLSATLFREQRTGYVKKFLKIGGHYVKGEARLVERFVDGYLRQDGVFTLRMVSKNAGDLMVCEMVSQLYANYRDKLTRFDRNGIPLGGGGGGGAAGGRASGGGLKRDESSATLQQQQHRRSLAVAAGGSAGPIDRKMSKHSSEKSMTAAATGRDR